MEIFQNKSPYCEVFFAVHRIFCADMRFPFHILLIEPRQRLHCLSRNLFLFLFSFVPNTLPFICANFPFFSSNWNFKTRSWMHTSVRAWFIPGTPSARGRSCASPSRPAHPCRFIGSIPAWR